MPVPFGFSVGDFISVCILIKDVVQALDSSRGSSAEYQEVIRELWALDRALLEVVNLAQNFEMTVELNALSHTARRTADQCLHCIKTFLAKIQAYEKPLSEGGSGNLLRDVKGKVTWALLKKDDLQKFRTEINAHSSAINMLLITASVSLTRLSHAKTQQRFEDAQRASGSSTQQQLKLMEQVKDTLGEQSRNLEAQGSTISRLADGVKYFFGLGAELKSLMLNLLTFSIRGYNVLLDIQNKLPPEVQPNWTQEPLTLTDALGRVAPIHLELINTWDILEAVLAARFANVPGEHKIRRREYALHDRTSKQDIRRNAPFNSCFLPGRRIDMCVLFQGKLSSQTSCLNCGCESSQNFASGAVCDQCGIWVQRVEELESLEDSPDVYSDPLERFTFAESASRKRKYDVSSESLHVFKRVRLFAKHTTSMRAVTESPRSIYLKRQRKMLREKIAASWSNGARGLDKLRAATRDLNEASSSLLQDAGRQLDLATSTLRSFFPDSTEQPVSRPNEDPNVLEWVNSVDIESEGGSHPTLTPDDRGGDSISNASIEAVNGPDDSMQTTLDVEDWSKFFGIESDLSALNDSRHLQPQRLPSMDMGINAILNRPGGGR